MVFPNLANSLLKQSAYRNNNPISIRHIPQSNEEVYLSPMERKIKHGRELAKRKAKIKRVDI